MTFPRRLPPPPSPLVETAIWILLAAIAIGLRLYVASHLPTYLWTRDSGSYVAPALDWLETGRWVTNPRRGPIYSLAIAWVLKAGGSFLTLVNLQAVLGVVTAGLTVAFARWRLGRAAFWPVAICALFYVAYPMPIYLERLIRNETLLIFFATVCFGAWRLALDEKQSRVGWSLVAGTAGGLMHLIKGIFPILPLLAIAIFAWQNRRRPMLAIVLSACFVLPFFAPKAASKYYDRASGTGRPPEPEDGIMFYGRTAQWTVLDGGFEPRIKALVRPQVERYMERYQKTGKLDNNEIIKRTVVPSLKGILEKERPGFTPTDLNRFCWRLGVEAALRHPGTYLWQMVRDFCYLNFITAHRFEEFRPSEVKASARDGTAYFAANLTAEDLTAARAFDLPGMNGTIHAMLEDKSLRGFDHWNDFWRYARVLSPIFLCGLMLPGLVYFTRGEERLYWLGVGVLWFYYLVLLSTVGRPLDRYLMPVVPLAFWAISRGVALGWERGVAFVPRAKIAKPQRGEERHGE